MRWRQFLRLLTVGYGIYAAYTWATDPRMVIASDNGYLLVSTDALWFAFANLTTVGLIIMLHRQDKRFAANARARQAIQDRIDYELGRRTDAYD